MQIDTVLLQPNISDAQERAGVPLAGTLTSVALDPTDPDTDGDGIPDGEEVHIDDFRADQDVGDDNVIAFPGYAWASDPGSLDSDGDGLTDSNETRGHFITTINKSGSAYRWEPNVTKANGSIEWTSDPMDPHSDDYGLDDATEVRETHTHPRQETTYNITREHQVIVDDLPPHLARGAHIAETSADLDSLELTDATDDFDFVFDDRVERTGDARVYDRLTFQMVDGREPAHDGVRLTTPTGISKLRSDRWLSNSEEIAFNELSDFLGVPRGPNARLDVWDPDTDDDGLTDGQELYGLTRGANYSLRPPTIVDDEDLQTSPVLADSDEDSQWDGWIGIYDVGRTDNVILYEEHLVSGGVRGDYIVQKQIHTHERSEDAPFGLGADIDGDGADEHSNLHLGELFWETDPNDGGDFPSPSVTYEVDYHSAADSALDSPDWRESIENNYALYGIDVDLQRDEELSDLQLEVINAGAPYAQLDLFNIATTYHDTNADEYLFVGSAAHSTITAGRQQTGLHNVRTIPLLLHQRMDAVFTHGHLNDLNQAPSGLSRDEKMRAISAKTAVHEIGHLLDLGEADDQSGDEIYSGTPPDLTPEFVENSSGDTIETWSVMSGGVPEEVFVEPTGTRYTGISIEEWISIDREPVNQ